jgi:septal ring factor EnvC (AmiA/AmiB activator)
MERLNTQLKDESVRQLKDQLKVLESRHLIAQKKIAEHRAAKQAIEAEIDATRDKITKLESGVPLEPDRSLEYSRNIKRQ